MIMARHFKPTEQEPKSLPHPALFTLKYPQKSQEHPSKRRRIQATSGSQASASRWFDRANHDVQCGTRSTSEFEHDSPFYLPHNTQPAESDVQPVMDQWQAERDSENEDLRSVIDDLTIENKRLKGMLDEHHHKRQDTLNNERIFEVRTHGLSTDKKRELEFILQQFASNLGSSPGPPQVSVAGVESRAQDSAYASLSVSGPVSVARSARGQASRKANDKNVRSYLSGIPAATPNAAVLNEQAKKRLVVKRLEHLFTGKKAAGEHRHPLQQQQTSESAALADRHQLQLLNKYIRPEGSREAHILPLGTGMDLDLPRMSWSKPETKPESERSSDEASGNRSPDQRPTRPLDLDIHRAQVAEDNMEYIRHLGLPTPTRNLESAHNDGWVYLNLIINMAQLHTMNVTPLFVQKSVTELSTRFELSKDGRKIRWKGDANEEISDEVESEADVTGSLNGVRDASMSKDVSSENLTSLSETPQRSKLSHNPSHGQKTTSKPSTASRPSQPKFVMDDLNSDLNNTDAVEDDGPVTYYKNCPFYCDLSRNQSVPAVSSRTRVQRGVLGVREYLDIERDAKPLAVTLDGDVPTLELEPLADNCENEDNIIDLPASGVGGVQPADHFSLLVRRQHRATPRHAGAAHSWQAKTRTSRITPKVTPSKPQNSEQVLSSTRIDLPASKLPPPSYLMLSMSSEDSSANDANEYFSEDPDDSGDERDIEAPPQLYRIRTQSSDRRRSDEKCDTVTEESMSEGEDGDEDEDVASEKGFDRMAALQQSVGVLTGSLAATVGEGSAASVASARFEEHSEVLMTG